jgi:hypothetical protein
LRFFKKRQIIMIENKMHIYINAGSFIVQDFIN